MDSKTKQLGAWLTEIGVDEIIAHQPTSKLKSKSSARKESKQELTPALNLTNLGENLGNSRKIADACQTLEEVFAAIREFNDCRLKDTANNTVYGEGATNSEILIVGEAPGAQEDLEGRPFCGDSGKVLDLMLGSIGLSRKKNVFITNTVFWRPPANRKPTNQELAMCLPFIERMIGFMKPKLIIMVGSVSSFNLTGQNIPMNELRKKTHEYSNKYLERAIQCFTIFHPAFLLRQPSQKKNTWFDLLNIQDHIAKQQIKIKEL